MQETNLKLYIIRHGKTLFNTHNKVQGWCDTPLTAEGEAAAVNVGRGLADIRFDAVYTSDSGRTIATARLITAQNHFQKSYSVHEMKEFREMYFGKFEGGSNTLIWDMIYEKVGGRNTAAPLGILLDTVSALDDTGEAENTAALHKRIKAGLDKVIKENRGKTAVILLVLHAVTILEMLHMLGFVPEIVERPPNVSVTILNYTPADGFSLETYADESYAAAGKEAGRWGQ
jgi:broad specificity phosphatase PhoE